MWTMNYFRFLELLLLGLLQEEHKVSESLFVFIFRGKGRGDTYGVDPKYRPIINRRTK